MVLENVIVSDCGWVPGSYQRYHIPSCHINSFIKHRTQALESHNTMTEIFAMRLTFNDTYSKTAL